MGAVYRALARFDLLEYPRQSHPIRQGDEARPLDRGAVRHRIAERHADLHHVANLGDRGQIVLERAPRRKSGREEIPPAPAGRAGRPRELPRKPRRAARTAAPHSLPQVLQKRPLQNGHVLVAPAGAADENARAAVSLRRSAARRRTRARFRWPAESPRTWRIPPAHPGLHRPSRIRRQRVRFSSGRRARGRRRSNRGRRTPNASPAPGHKRPAVSACSCPARHREFRKSARPRCPRVRRRGRPPPRRSVSPPRRPRKDGTSRWRSSRRPRRPRRHPASRPPIPASAPAPRARSPPAVRAPGRDTGAVPPRSPGSSTCRRDRTPNHARPRRSPRARSHRRRSRARPWRPASCMRPTLGACRCTSTAPM